MNNETPLRLLALVWALRWADSHNASVQGIWGYQTGAGAREHLVFRRDTQLFILQENHEYPIDPQHTPNRLPIRPISAEDYQAAWQIAFPNLEHNE
jgi:hypothetical protein